ncbi:SEC-C metal-binding domain-containing protein [Anaerocolumna sp. AGMB13025]|uniref:SEC-C metal-binding domain-containing protein n=1 Tax=Anaerocolumna sp. AGMB13025 TaxID=3039116 RepID=UPI00241C4D0F|nr:SEC-C metal-binding domain-containing protein [Anaerocolumna sp. AGMB13025]WFR58902.1 SEC-C metal-binding domain-containing protein [Anaerocolumna sp. AGMB13025]
MRESRDQIANHIKQYKPQHVTLLYELMVRILLGNNDFRLVEKADRDDLFPVIEKETGKTIDYQLDTIIGKEALKTFKKIEELEFSETKLKKAQRVELMADVLGDDTLFEGFCLTFYETDEALLGLCENFGCPERYNELAKNEVYQKRKKYMRLVADYAMAAVNLYGVIHVAELQTLILEYENKFDDKGYNHVDGNYKNTVMFTPEFMCTCTLHQLIGDAVPVVCTTMDGLLLHSSFVDAYQNEQEKMLQFFSKMKREVTEKDLERFYKSVGASSFRILYEDAGLKQMYHPSKREFLRYTDDNYYEISNAEKQMRKYVEKKFLPNFENVAQKAGVTVNECMDDFMNELHDQATDMGKSGEERDPHEYAQFIFESMQGYGIDFEDTDQVNEFLGYAMKIMNSVRLWCNHGCTPDEAMRQTTLYSDSTTIVPGSSKAAGMLVEGREQLGQMGIKIDLDATATDISSFSFENGMNGTMTKNTKKVYPNDPCPCGSGKKFKKCCGKL